MVEGGARESQGERGDVGEEGWRKKGRERERERERDGERKGERD